MSKKPKRKPKPHSEVRWVVKYTRTTDGEEYFGSMLTHKKSTLPNMLTNSYTTRKVKVLVTEIVKGKR